MALILDPVSLISPELSGSTLSVDLESLPLVVDAPAEALALECTLAETGQTVEATTYSLSGGLHRFSVDFPLPDETGTYNLSIRAKDAAGTGYAKVSPNLALVIVKASNADVVEIFPPASVSVERLSSLATVKWQTPTTEGFLGVRVRTSTDETGIATPYTQWGNLITASAVSQQDTITSSTTYTVSGDALHRVTTEDETLTEVEYSKAEFYLASAPAETFYVMLTSVVQDPLTHHVHESYAVGPFECTYVDLRKVLLTDFPPKSSANEIATRMVETIAPKYPGLDLFPRTEPRDVLVDPVAQELYYAFVRNWFSNVCHSVGALAQLDDEDGDGVTDDPATSPLKQTVAMAFRLTNAQTQVLIDKAFDNLGTRAGIDRLPKQAAIVDVTFYLKTKPTKRYTISEGSIVSTVPDTTTDSVSFKTLGSGVIDPTNADSYYIASRGWWGVTVPCICLTLGSVGNVGAGTLRTLTSGTSSPMSCTNLYASDYGEDLESNSHYASRITDRLVIGVDTGRRLGYKELAQKASGVISAQVVSSGDVEMLRDWDDVRKKHVYGTTDIYVRGRATGQEALQYPYTCGVEGTFGSQKTYYSMQVMDTAKLQIGFASLTPDLPCAALVELAVLRSAGSSLNFYFGVAHAYYDPESHTFFLNGDDLTYTKSGDTEIIPGAKNSALIGSLGTSSVLALIKEWSPLAVTPVNQPVTQVYSVVGPASAIPSDLIRLVKTQDPQLLGGSASAGDRVIVDNDTVSEVVTVRFPTNGTDLVDLGEGISLASNLNGKPTAFPAVRSADAQTLYTYGTDYSPVVLGQHGHFGIKRLASGAIAQNKDLLVTVDRHRFREVLTLRTESVTLTGATPVALSNKGFVRETYSPESHQLLTLLDDADLQTIARAKRYIKVVYSGTVMVEGKDFVLEVGTTGVASVSRYVSGGTVLSRIPDGGSVTVTYYTAEVFTVTTRYPQFIQQLAQTVEKHRHTAADVIVKAMTENPVDADFTVELASNASVEVVDPKIRTAFTAACNNASSSLTQAEIVKQLKSIAGVKNVRIPFRRMAKADGAYDIGLIVPTGTSWVPMSTFGDSDPMFGARTWDVKTYITKEPVLRYSTLPSGGRKDAYVGMLYEGEAYTRTLSLDEIRAETNAAFYVIGTNDGFDSASPVDAAHYGKVILVLPKGSTISDPTEIAFHLTYQVYGEAGASDIPIGPMECLVPGNITVDYVLED